ncbi:MAG: DUF5668 domain-containing protein [Bacillota bacterium]|nr:DUF5668 domain-containing protein [Bacillota bacterium]
MAISTFIMGLILILVGTWLFLNNLGYISLGFIRQIFNFWPILLIIIGMSFFWRGRIPRWLAFALIIVLTGGVIALAFVTPQQNQIMNGETYLKVDRSDYAELSSGELDVKFGGGKLYLGPSPNSWFEGDFRGPGGAVSSVNEQNKKLTLHLRQPDNFTWGIRRGAMNNWNMKLSHELLWDISLEAGAVEGDLQLHGIPLQDVEVKLGAGDLTMKFGENGEQVSVLIKAGASNLKVQVPDNTGIRIEIKGALASTNLKDIDGLIINDTYVSPDYDTAPSRIDFKVEMGVGNFNLERFPFTI